MPVLRNARRRTTSLADVVFIQRMVPSTFPSSKGRVIKRDYSRCHARSYRCVAFKGFVSASVSNFCKCTDSNVINKSIEDVRQSKIIVKIKIKPKAIIWKKKKINFSFYRHREAIITGWRLLADSVYSKPRIIRTFTSQIATFKWQNNDIVIFPPLHFCPNIKTIRTLNSLSPDTSLLHCLRVKDVTPLFVHPSSLPEYSHVCLPDLRHGHVSSQSSGSLVATGAEGLGMGRESGL